eukprot:jgi/Tetstr1/430045/TSEL_019906.t1
MCQLPNRHWYHTQARSPTRTATRLEITGRQDELELQPHWRGESSAKERRATLRGEEMGRDADGEEAGPTSVARPVSSQLNKLLNLAHKTHDRRKAEGKLHYPFTKEYESFDQEQQMRTATGWQRNDAVTAMFGSKIRNPSTLGASSTAFITSLTGPMPGSYNLIEVTCQHDANVQKSDLKGTVGSPTRPGIQPTVGPVTTLFRWYARRSIALGCQQPENMPPKLIEDAKLSLSMRQGGNWDNDPVMNCKEITAMLEDYGLVPGELRRGDVQRAFAMVAGCPKKGHVVPNPHPEELRYPEFCQLLVRLGLLLNSKPETSQWYPQDEDRLKAFTDRLLITSPNTRQLQIKLAAFRRTARDRSVMRRERKIDYMATPSAFDTAASLPPSFKTFLPGSNNGAKHVNWNPTKAEPVPKPLLQQLLAGDAAALSKMQPKWTAFDGTKLDMGIVSLGDIRKYRVVLRNRTKRQVRFETNVVGGSWIDTFHSEEPLASCLPRVLEITARFDQVGELRGSIEVRASEIHIYNAPIEEVVIPIYARVMEI